MSVQAKKVPLSLTHYLFNVVKKCKMITYFLDLEEEKIHLSKAAKISINDLPRQVPEDKARYHLYLFRHKHEGDQMDSISMT